MSEPLAPSRSARPTPRVPPEERRARDRASADAMMEAFAALEDRADIDPYLVNNPLRRLGYRETGGLSGVDYLPLAPNEAAYFGIGYGEAHLNQEISDDVLYGSGLPIFRSIELMDPERAAAFDSGETPYLMPPRTSAIGPDYFALPVQAHEAGHAGFDFIEDVLRDRPHLRRRFTDAGLPSTAGRDFEEAVVELGDDPDAMWIQPRSEGRPVGTYQTAEHTIQYLPDRGTGEFAVSERDFERVQRFELIMQELAAEELARRGEPPRAVMQEPGPGNMFYREPEQRGGLRDLIDRIRGN